MQPWKTELRLIKLAVPNVTVMSGRIITTGCLKFITCLPNSGGTVFLRSPSNQSANKTRCSTPRSDVFFAQTKISCQRQVPTYSMAEVRKRLYLNHCLTLLQNVDYNVAILYTYKAKMDSIVFIQYTTDTGRRPAVRRKN